MSDAREVRCRCGIMVETQEDCLCDEIALLRARVEELTRWNYEDKADYLKRIAELEDELRKWPCSCLAPGDCCPSCESRRVMRGEASDEWAE